ncbi:hypothetical protein [Burkholderia sp. L27(2015)]|uniref:hypothetical protein n=1 Tax=Burkholderia sp. L27(2015) TaxID=1641858 RepID=UPI00131A9916|nr:hypothetical protein [Burkholderia sp. L27(2015)]
MLSAASLEKETDLQPYSDQSQQQNYADDTAQDDWFHLPQTGFPLSYSTPGHCSMGW